MGWPGSPPASRGRGVTVLQFFRNMELENSSYFQDVETNFSIFVFINLIKLYFLGTTQ